VIFISLLLHYHVSLYVYTVGDIVIRSVCLSIILVDCIILSENIIKHFSHLVSPSFYFHYYETTLTVMAKYRLGREIVLCHCVTVSAYVVSLIF